jgi:hypothetical protein
MVNLYDLKNRSVLLRLHTADLLALFKLHHEWCKQHHQRRNTQLPQWQQPQRLRQ